MKWPLIETPAFILFLLLLTGPAFAGGLSTSGQGTRALGMGGAFTAVADDGASVYYNPAGISQINGTLMEAGTTFIYPEIKYKMSDGATEKSTKSAIAPTLFITHRIAEKFSAGLGIYTPYARVAEFGDDPANRFAFQRSKMVRTDLSIVISYKISDNVSIGGGPIIGYSQIDQSIPAGPALRIKDKMDGVGYGGIIGLLWKVNEFLKAGVTYRTRMSVDNRGQRTIAAGGMEIKSDSRSEVRYPASLGLGIALAPSENATISLDADWYEWSYMDQVIVKTDAWPDSVCKLNARNSWDVRIGGEYRLRDGWSLRAGYAYIQGAFPNSNIIPSKPDADGHEIDLGIGKQMGNWKIDLSYGYAVTREEYASANIYGFNGKYNIKQHSAGLTVAYRF